MRSPAPEVTRAETEEEAIEEAEEIYGDIAEDFRIEKSLLGGTTP